MPTIHDSSLYCLKLILPVIIIQLELDLLHALDVAAAERFWPIMATIAEEFCNNIMNPLQLFGSRLQHFFTVVMFAACWPIPHAAQRNHKSKRSR